MTSEETLKKSKNLITFFVFQVNSLLDSGETLDFKEAREISEEGNIVDFLAEKFKGKIDLSIITDDFKEAFNEKMSDISSGFFGSERKKMGTENNGLCLLVGYATEMIQQVR